jgi:GTP-binding protein LepA
MKLDAIRNFCIIAHIDHGKSTLADRLLELTGTVEKRKMREQFLDGHAIERERGITIKAKAVAMQYGKLSLNLIDTPGHVDFSYEVSRSLAACEGALLLVDATQGVQAQTVANARLAEEGGLTIVPALNKIDLENARPDEVAAEIETTLGLDRSRLLRLSAKSGAGVSEMLDALIARVPPPDGDPAAPPRALIFDSVYDEFRAVIVYVRMIDGTLRPGDAIRLRRSGAVHQIEEVGTFRPQMDPTRELSAGQVGYVIAGVKSVREVHVGDTLVGAADETTPALPGYREPKAMVFCGFYPDVETSFDELRKALERMSLNDSSFTYEPDSSEALGHGYRCGFLGLLHMDILQEKLRRDQSVEVIKTAPNVTYELLARRGGKEEVLHVDNPARIPDEADIVEWREPYVRLDLILPADCIGATLKLCEDRRGLYVKTEYISPTRVMIAYDLPFPEMILDFYDRFKSVTRGYGSMDYHLIGYFPGELCRLRILVAEQEVDALSTIVHRDNAYRIGRRILQVLRKEIPRQMFQVALQAAIGAKIIAREDIKPFKKHVTGKCYGGDITRKRKLWEKQKEGKKKMKAIGRVEVPQEAFMAVLKASQESES